MSTRPALPFVATLKVRDTCLCLAAQRAARVLARHFDEVLRPAGLSNGQYSLLNALNRPAPPVMGDVAALLAMDRTTLTAALKALQRRGLVRVAVDEKDRRGRRLSLTAEGQRVLAHAYVLWKAAHAALEDGLPPASPGRLRRDLGHLTGHIAAPG